MNLLECTLGTIYGTEIKKKHMHVVANYKIYSITICSYYYFKLKLLCESKIYMCYIVYMGHVYLVKDHVQYI